MGTFWHVTVVDSETVDKNILDQLIKQELLAINQQFSTYISDSEISQFNSHQSTEPFNVTEAVVKVVEAANILSEQSNGAFDITVAPLVSLWGFGSKIILNKPSEETIKQAQKNTGYHHLTIIENPPQLVKAIPLLSIDLSAIAKGYGVDRIAALLEQLGVQNYLVDIGGELKVKGRNPKAERWQIAIEKPMLRQTNSNSRLAQQIISLENIAVATSGDYHNYFEEKGVRYSHTIDPKTGKPVTHQLASVTVLHESAMIADALATAIMVLGEQKGLVFSQQQGVQVYMVIRTIDGFRVVSTLRIQ